jgi:exodeoxyribonuclease VII small subunit
VAVADLSYSDAGAQLDSIIEEFETGVVDVDRLVEQLERATDIVDELDRRLRRTRMRVEELVPRLESIGRNGADADDGPDEIGSEDDEELGSGGDGGTAPGLF